MKSVKPTSRAMGTLYFQSLRHGSAKDFEGCGLMVVKWSGGVFVFCVGFLFSIAFSATIETSTNTRTKQTNLTLTIKTF